MTESLKDAVRDLWRDAARRIDGDVRRAPGSFSWDRLLKTLTGSLVEQGVDESWIQVGRRAMLPGAYGLGRSAWDLAVLKDGVPLGAISFKA
jgi:Restriction endonuclease XhoI/Domain of unknown function (DUF4263)